MEIDGISSSIVCTISYTKLSKLFEASFLISCFFRWSFQFTRNITHTVLFSFISDCWNTLSYTFSTSFEWQIQSRVVFCIHWQGRFSNLPDRGKNRARKYKYFAVIYLNGHYGLFKKDAKLIQYYPMRMVPTYAN